MNWKEELENMHKKFVTHTKESGQGNLAGLQSIADGLSQGTTEQAPVPQKMADGGMVTSPNDVLAQIAQLSGMQSPQADPQQPQPQPAPAPMPTDAPQVPDIRAVLNNAQNTPPTDYNLYKDISADDRAALYKQLAQQQNSPASLVTQGIGGLGDAISRSFGHQNTNYQQGIMDTEKAGAASNLGAVDTQRAQRLQDIQGSTEMASNDPNSPLSKSMQKTFKSAGINVPSGMPASMMMKIAPALGELAIKQATLNNTVNNDVQGRNIQKQGLAEKEMEHKTTVAKDLQERPWYQKAVETVPAFQSDATRQMKSELDQPGTMSGNGWTIKKKGS